MTDIEWPAPKEQSADEGQQGTYDDLTREEILAVLGNYSPDARPLLTDPKRPKATSRSEAYPILDFILRRTKVWAERETAHERADKRGSTEEDLRAYRIVNEQFSRAYDLVLNYLNREADELQKGAAEVQSSWWLEHLGADEEHAVTVVEFTDAVKKSDKWARTTLALGVRRGIVATGERRTRTGGTPAKVYWRATSNDDAAAE